MINFIEKQIFDPNLLVYKCLSFDPFDFNPDLENKKDIKISNFYYLEEIPNYNEIYNIKKQNKIKEKLDFYKCSEKCFKTNQRISILKANAHEACYCVKLCLISI